MLTSHKMLIGEYLDTKILTEEMWPPQTQWRTCWWPTSSLLLNSSPTSQDWGLCHSKIGGSSETIQSCHYQNLVFQSRLKFILIVVPWHWNQMNESWQQLQDGQSPLPVVIDNQCLCPFIKRQNQHRGKKSVYLSNSDWLLLHWSRWDDWFLVSKG